MGKMEMLICTIHEWVFNLLIGDIDNGIKARTSFDVPDYWTCQSCGLVKTSLSLCLTCRVGH